MSEILNSYSIQCFFLLFVIIMKRLLWYLTAGSKGRGNGRTGDQIKDQTQTKLQKKLKDISYTTT